MPVDIFEGDFVAKLFHACISLPRQMRTRCCRSLRADSICKWMCVLIDENTHVAVLTRDMIITVKSNKMDHVKMENMHLLIRHTEQRIPFLPFPELP